MVRSEKGANSIIGQVIFFLLPFLTLGSGSRGDERFLLLLLGTLKMNEQLLASQ